MLGDRPSDKPFELACVRTTLGPVGADGVLSWLRMGAGDPRVLAWPVVLLPDYAAGRPTMPPDSVGVYHRVEWSAPLPAGPLEVTTRPARARRVGNRWEFQLDTEAVVDGDVVAAARIGCYTARELCPQGGDDLPRPPEPAVLTPVRHLAISEHEVRDFSERARTRYLATSSHVPAQEMGFRHTLVPSPLITVVHLAAGQVVGPAGSIEVWCRGPVTAGSAMALCRHGRDGLGWALRPIGSERPATVSRARIVPPR